MSPPAGSDVAAAAAKADPIGDALLDVPGPGHAEEPKRAGDHAEYCVMLRSPSTGITTKVWHRYREFRALLSHVRKRAPGVPPPPPKKLFGDKFRPELLAARAAQLQQCLRVALMSPELRTQPDIRRSLEAFVGAGEMNERRTRASTLMGASSATLPALMPADAPRSPADEVVADFAEGPVTQLQVGLSELGLAKALPPSATDSIDAAPTMSFEWRPSALATLGLPNESFVTCTDEPAEEDDAVVVLVTRHRAEMLQRQVSTLTTADGPDTPLPAPNTSVHTVAGSAPPTERRSATDEQAQEAAAALTASVAQCGDAPQVSRQTSRPFTAAPAARRGRARKPTFARVPETRDYGIRCPAELPRAAPQRLMTAWDFLSTAAPREHLLGGGALFACSAAPGSVLSSVERAIVASYIDYSAFKDERAENGVCPVDMGSEQDVNDHIFLLTKGMFLLPHGTTATSFTPERWSSVEFQKSIAPAGCKVHPKVRNRDGKVIESKDTFCCSKEVIPWVFSVTTQYKVSVIPAHKLAPLSALAGGVPLVHGLLLERTKQDRGQDATKRAKQVLLFHDVQGGGLLVTQVCFSVFTSLPSVVRKVIDKIGAKGATELSEMAAKLREHHVR
eukprot:TRINITY_DN1604_c2_g1_i1.p1 TRINITY_DN1604_c2_g1~~TRINITY_DN1604_c2_g1_i1.p1  ORF type:complete len:658 (+),score=221.77 TRINITY_DN1604_c2_g1_i1:116-1975(+)